MTHASTSPCATCGLCCRSYIVPLCGYDVWSIATHERLGPEHFVIAVRQEKPGADGFLLEAGQPPYGLALEKRGQLRPTQPCVFLVRLGNGHDRCGVYAHRPVVCRGYPMTLHANAIEQRSDALCPPNSWPDVDPSDAHWDQALRSQRMRFDIYHEVVRRWNESVERRPEPVPTLSEYLAYVMNAYALLSRLDSELGDARVAATIREWPSDARDASEKQTSVVSRSAAPSWAIYFARAGGTLANLRPRT